LQQQCSNTKSLGVASPDGSTVQALDDIGVYRNGGMINAREKSQ
jgi:hypothetical protein